MSLATMAGRTTCTLERKTSSKDASGGMVNTFAAVTGYTNIPCTFHAMSGNTRLRYQQEQQTTMWTIYFDRAIPVVAQDRFTSNGKTYLFLGRTPQAPGYENSGTKGGADRIDVQEQL